MLGPLDLGVSLIHRENCQEASESIVCYINVSVGLTF